MQPEIPSLYGSWSEVFEWPLIGLHVIITPDNKILSFGTQTSGAQGGFVYDVWDIATNTHYTLPNKTATDIFCSACILVPLTGEILIGGGDARPLGKVNQGVDDVNVFNYQDMSLSASITGDMAYARWYPTTISLANGKVLMLGGRDINGKGVGTPELYTPDVGWKTLTGAYSAEVAKDWWYPRTFLNGDGNVVLFGTNNNASGSFTIQIMDPSGSGSITTVGKLPFETASGMPAVMFDQNKTLIIGSDGSTWIMDIGGDTPTFTRTDDLGANRIWSNLVVLADGTVLASGGSAVNTAQTSTLVNPSYDAAIWNPATGHWTTVDDAHVARLYHSTTILLPDATVLSLGGGAPGPVYNLNGEIYKPSYLFDANGNLATRPVILDAPEKVEQRETFAIVLDDATDIARLTFVKAGSVTHSLNMTTTKIELEFTTGPGNTVQITLPENSNILTAGQWMLFAFNSKGTPSVAATIQVGLGGELFSETLHSYLTLNGRASFDATTDIFTLTPDAKSALGAVMSNDKINLAYDFELKFDAYFGAKDAGADGMGFLLHNDPSGADAVGSGGGSHGLTGIRSGLGVEFDTHKNPGADISADHTNFVDTDVPYASRNISQQVSLGNIEDSTWHNVTVAWDAASGTLRYWFDGKLAGTLQNDIINTYLGGSSAAYFGFTASTGGGSNLHQLKIVSFDGQLTSDPAAGGTLAPSELGKHLVLMGSATFTERTGVITLTPNAANKLGSATLDDRVNLLFNFKISFQVNLGSSDAGADGLGFVLHDDPRGASAVGNGGGAIGLTGIVNGLGIEFDTHKNGSTDIAPDHTNFVDTDVAGADRNISSPASLGNIEDGAWHSVVVDWNASTQTLRYWFDGKLAGTLQSDIVNNYLGGSSLANLGFTGATGGRSNLQQVKVLSLDGEFSSAPANGVAIDPAKLAQIIKLNGDARYDQSTNIVTLTPDAPSKLGGVTIQDRVDLAHDFTLVFQLNLGSKDAGADGMAFVMHADPRGAEAIGIGGGGLGLTGIAFGLGIEFDTWKNATIAGEIATDHTNFIDTEANINLRNESKPVSLGNIEDGAWHNVIVDWDASAQKLRYWFDGNLVGTMEKDIVAAYFGGSSLVYFGLTGATGGASNLQQAKLTHLDATFESGESFSTTLDQHDPLIDLHGLHI